MAKPKMPIKTPLCELRWCHISGQGKLRYDPDNKLDKEDPNSYEYTVTAVLTKEQADSIRAQMDAFWKENMKGRPKYDIININHYF